METEVLQEIHRMQKGNCNQKLLTGEWGTERADKRPDCKAVAEEPVGLHMLYCCYTQLQQDKAGIATAAVWWTGIEQSAEDCR